MKTIEFKSNYSSFAYRMTAEVGDEVNAATTALCLEGIANLCYRTAGSNVDKALGVKSKKNGGMGREGVAYDATLAEVINAAVNTKITELENAEGSQLKGLKLSFAVTGEHVAGDSGNLPTKEATELWTSVQAKPEDAFLKALKVLGLDAADYNDASGILACKKFLQDAKRAAALAAKTSLGI